MRIFTQFTKHVIQRPVCSTRIHEKHSSKQRKRASGEAALSDISDLYSPVIPRHSTSVPEEARRGQRRDIRLLFALTFKFIGTRRPSKIA